MFNGIFHSDSISPKLGRTRLLLRINGDVLFLDEFGPMKKELGVAQIQEFLENENKATDFSEIQYGDNLL